MHRSCYLYITVNTSYLQVDDYITDGYIASIYNYLLESFIAIHFLKFSLIGTYRRFCHYTAKYRSTKSYILECFTQ